MHEWLIQIIIIYLQLIKCCLSFLIKDDLEYVHGWVTCAGASGPDASSRVSSMFSLCFCKESLARKRRTGLQSDQGLWPSTLNLCCIDTSLQTVPWREHIIRNSERQRYVMWVRFYCLATSAPWVVQFT